MTTAATPPTIRWNESTRLAVEGHARVAYPQECCGVLIGTRDGEEIVLWRGIPAKNLAPLERQGDRYVVDPLEILRAERTAQAEGALLVGFYHSHPDHPAIPSATDTELAWPEYLYVIVQVDREGRAESRAWQWAREGVPPMACPLREETGRPSPPSPQGPLTSS